MNPYLEDPYHWPDFHASFLVALRAAINVVLPERYVALLDRHVWGHDSDTQTNVALGISVVQNKGNVYIRLFDRERRRIVTVLELLSQSNKEPGRDRDAYLAKRNGYLASETNLVEIDFLRGGQRSLLGDPAPPQTDYYALVCRATEAPKAGLWPFSVRERIPPLHVPLLPNDVSPTVDMKPCLDRAYDECQFTKVLDYSEPPVPPLREPDATWSRELLANRGN
jgi:uncharacterized protein DUF4058